MFNTTYMPVQNNIPAARNTKGLNPQVAELLKPIIMNTTMLYNKQQYASSMPVFSQISLKETDDEKKAKKECMHMIFNQNGLIEYILEECDRPGYKLCPVCKKYVPLEFKDEHVNVLLEAIDIINQLAFFGTLLGLRADGIKTLIGLKAVLPDVVTLLDQLNKYVRLDSKNADNLSSFASEYTDKRLTHWLSA